MFQFACVVVVVVVTIIIDLETSQGDLVVERRASNDRRLAHDILAEPSSDAPCTRALEKSLRSKHRILALALTVRRRGDDLHVARGGRGMDDDY